MVKMTKTTTRWICRSAQSRRKVGLVCRVSPLPVCTLTTERGGGKKTSVYVKLGIQCMVFSVVLAQDLRIHCWIEFLVVIRAVYMGCEDRLSAPD